MNADYYFPLLIALLLLLVLAALGCQSDELADGVEISSEDLPLADSLSAIYVSLIKAIRSDDVSKLKTYFDPLEFVKISPQSKVSKRYANQNYLGWIVNNWPTVENKQAVELVRSDPYVRLTYLINPDSDNDLKRYSFLLFKKNRDNWQFVTYSELSKEPYGLHGFSLSYHETDLPPRLRFPRRF